MSPLFPGPCDSHDTDSDRRQGAGTVWGAREQRARTDLVDNVKNPQFNLRALFRLRDRCLMMYCQSSSWSGDMSGRAIRSDANLLSAFALMIGGALSVGLPLTLVIIWLCA